MDKRRSVETLEKRQATNTKRYEDAKAKIRAKRSAPKQELTEADWEVRAMADAYEDALSEYSGTCRKIFAARMLPGVRWYSTLARAIKFAKEMEIAFDVYIKGLFYVANKWGNRAPKVQELADYKTKVTAKDRVAMFLATNPTKEAKVVGILRPQAEIPQAVKSLHSEKQLKALMSNLGLTEEEVFKKFAMGKDYINYFDRKWLVGHPTYQQLKEQGND